MTMQEERAMSAPRELTVEDALAAIRATEVEFRDARARFDQAITRAKLETSASYAQVAEAAGLTRSGVQAVLRRTA